MILNGQTVGGLTVYCVDASFKAIVDVDDEWSDSRGVKCVLYKSIRHMTPQLQADIVYPSFNTQWMILNGQTEEGYIKLKQFLHTIRN